jgi:RNA polymerase sigma-70 factor (ECF subfamily)
VDSDLQLLQAWRDGDALAGNRLFRRHFDAVFWFFRTKVGDAAEDLTQETFHALVRNRDSVADAVSFRAYLFATARSKLYDLLRRKQRRGELDPLSDSVEDLGLSPSQILGQRREQVMLVQALRRLPIELQTLLELRYFEMMRGPDLAAAMALPEGTIRSRLRRAHELLRKAIAGLADEPSLVESTMTDLSKWAREVRESEDKDKDKDKDEGDA